MWHYSKMSNKNKYSHKKFAMNVFELNYRTRFNTIKVGQIQAQNLTTSLKNQKYINYILVIVKTITLDKRVEISKVVSRTSTALKSNNMTTQKFAFTKFLLTRTIII